MKRVTAVLFLALAVVFTGCANENEKTGVTGTRSGRGNPTNAAGLNKFISNSDGDVGSILAPAGSDEAFKKSIQGLLSASVDPTGLGAVSPTIGQPTWVRFLMKIKLLASGQVDPSNFSFDIMVMDDAAASAADYDKVPPYHLQISTKLGGTVKGQLAGNELTLEFTDEYGTVRLKGTLQNNNTVFVGPAVSYANAKFYDGSQEPVEGTLGGFQIPVAGSITQ